MLTFCQGMISLLFDDWLKNIQTVLVGPRCVLCRAAAPLARELCDGCLAELPWLEQGCLHCALPQTSSGARRCPACWRQPCFDHAVAAFSYHEPVRWLIGGLKFRGRLAHARLLGDLLAEQIRAAALQPPEALIPVPLHTAGYRRRGFNQAEHLAARISRAFDCPLDTAAIARIRDTAPQRDLPAAQRAANVRGAFACQRPLAWRHVAIVDDVVTTTRTAAAVATCLRAAGVERVDLYCVARA